jgi:hypothetical protein
VGSSAAGAGWTSAATRASGWAIQGAHWEPGTILPDGEPDDGLGRCAQCGGPLGDRRVLLIRHRGEHRIGDAFCGIEHLLSWAKAGGRWR